MIEPEAFAAHWISAWNNHDLDEILRHYGSDIVFCHRWPLPELGAVGSLGLMLCGPIGTQVSQPNLN
ncbi:MAG: hypothetical protein CGW95_08650 [Phenylobacterium zucineum]|nr:MAG: hypothetical protein CGW95_08650 [Phenylobacterium zucineum]